MCKYCEGGQAIALEEKGIGFDPTAEIDGDRITIGYWAQDCHGQDQHNAASIAASYCPLCGKKLRGDAS